MAAIAFYISGHGFGHASRQIEIINALARRRPDAGILLRTAVPRWLPHRTLNAAFVLDDRPCDTGIVQIDSLHLDAAATIAQADAFHRTLGARAEAEAALLREHGVRFVVADAPPLGCAAAARAGIPSVVVSNFTWDWIYEYYAEHLAAAPELIPAIQGAYREAAAAWRLPMHGGFATFETIVDMPFVARHGRSGRPRSDVLASLGIPADRPVVLVSFGGYGVDDLPSAGLDCSDWTVVFTGATPARRDGRVVTVDERELYAAGWRYEDLVRAVDVVLTKPGYGIISECIANDTALVYTSRGRFAEYDVLVREMPRYLRCAYIDNETLLAGRWRLALESAVDAPPPPEQPRTDGADVIADMIAAKIPSA